MLDAKKLALRELVPGCFPPSPTDAGLQIVNERVRFFLLARSRLSVGSCVTGYPVIKRGARGLSRRARLFWLRQTPATCHGTALPSILVKGGGDSGALGLSV